MKKVYRIISTILIAAMITSSLSVMAAPNYVEQTDEVLGTSVQTPAEPTSAKPSDDDIKLDIVDGVIQIDDEQELNKIGNDNNYPLDGEYILTTDITMTENLHPIGNDEEPFTGTFDGDGHVIYDLTIEEEGDNVGLFGVVSEGGVVKNIGVEEGSVTSEGLKVGGLVGWAAEATIENSYFVGDVSGDVAVGGVVGASGQIGAFNTASTIKNCYQVGTVKGNNVVGGIEGVVASPGFSFSNMENCYHVGEIICSDVWCGGLIGYLYAEISYYFENNYYDNEQCGSTVKNAVGYQTINKYSSNIKGLTTDQMTGPNAFNNMIGMEEAYTAPPQQKKYKYTEHYYYYYPQLNIFIDDVSDMNFYPRIEIYEPKDNTPVKPVEDNDPSTISTAEELQKIGNDDEYPLDGNYRLTNDIDMSGVEKFEPIGTKSDKFTGTFDGCNHVITGLSVNGNDIDNAFGIYGDDYMGLFGCVGGEGIVKNLGVEGTVKGDDYVGGIVGWLAGSSDLYNCYFIGDVEGDNSVGGLVGYTGDAGFWPATSGTGYVSKGYHIGEVKGRENVGGIMGKAVNPYYAVTSLRISNCYHSGEIICKKDGGGLVGYFDAAAPGSEMSIYKADPFHNSYYNKDTSGNATAAIGGSNIDKFNNKDLDDFKGLTADEMSGPNALKNMAGMEGYTAAPIEKTGVNPNYVYYYPQLTSFVNDASDPYEFPRELSWI